MKISQCYGISTNQDIDGRVIIIIIIINEYEDFTVLWNQAVNTDRKVTADRQDITIKTKTKNETCGNIHRQKCRAKGNDKEAKT